MGGEYGLEALGAWIVAVFCDDESAGDLLPDNPLCGFSHRSRRLARREYEHAPRLETRFLDQDGVAFELQRALHGPLRIRGGETGREYLLEVIAHKDIVTTREFGAWLGYASGGRRVGMRFSANVSILFKEVPLLERFGRAAAAGFSVVEFWWPGHETELEAVERAVGDAGLDVALFNFDAGDMAAGDRGLVSDPERQHLFRENVPMALDLARALGCERMNVLVGHEIPGLDREVQLALARENLRFAAEKAEVADITVMVEAVNTFENGPYLLYTTEQAVEFVEHVERENVWIQHDFYHMQRMEGNLVANLREHFDQIGHVQIADSPGRGEPGTGEIHYPYVLAALEDLGYDGYVGLEYNPTTETTEESLKWLPKELRGGDVNVSDLGL
jgi:hydroxypyruvate isomerase